MCAVLAAAHYIVCVCVTNCGAAAVSSVAALLVCLFECEFRRRAGRRHTLV